MSPTRVKNDSFCIPNFSVLARSKYIFLLLERASQDVGAHGSRFFELVIFKRKKEIKSSMTEKSVKKW